jgi:pyruvate/2-oxoglutarate dehydrogenase complex dihydrolipoamide acyltransferase (E2) component
LPQAIVMPEMGMYMEEGVLTNWLRPQGARVEAGEPILEITTEKVTFEVPAPAAGILHRAAEVGASLQVQALLGYILAEGEALPGSSEPEMIAPRVPSDGQRSLHSLPEAARSAGPPKASPAARQLAAQHGIDLRLVKGSGPGGQIVAADVLARVSRQQT